MRTTKSRRESQQESLAYVAIGAVILIVGGYALSVLAGGGSEARPSKTSGKSRIINGPMLVCADVESLNKFAKASATKDESVVADLVNADMAFEVDDAIAVRILEPGVMRKKIRVLDGPYKGRVGYIASEFVE